MKLASGTQLVQFKFHPCVGLFCSDNLAQDTYLISQMNEEHWVPIWTIANFKAVRRLTPDFKLVVEVLRGRFFNYFTFCSLLKLSKESHLCFRAHQLRFKSTFSRYSSGKAYGARLILALCSILARSWPGVVSVACSHA